jgi:hypothetical protein
MPEGFDATVPDPAPPIETESVNFNSTVNERETCNAAVKLASPAWSAVIVHVPAAKSVTVVPLTPEVEHTVPVVEANITGLVEPPPAALTVKGGSPRN